MARWLHAMSLCLHAATIGVEPMKSQGEKLSYTHALIRMLPEVWGFPAAHVSAFLGWLLILLWVATYTHQVDSFCFSIRLDVKASELLMTTSNWLIPGGLEVNPL